MRNLGRAVAIGHALIAALLTSGCAGPTNRPTQVGAIRLDGDADGLGDRLDRCPSAPEDRDGHQDEDGCPDPDNDGDAIADPDDLCANDPEDADGFEDPDGCPDPDNDRDRIADARDTCPNEAEVYNGTRDEDGCPDEGHVEVISCPNGIIERIYFRPRSSSIRRVAVPIVDAIAATLNANPGIELVAVLGRSTAAEGPADSIALRRATAVRDALVARDVAPTRLEAWTVGTRASLGTEELDRSVELLIRRRAGEQMNHPALEQARQSP